MRAGITVLATAFASTVASSVSWDIFGKVDKASASLSFWGGGGMGGGQRGGRVVCRLLKSLISQRLPLRISSPSLLGAEQPDSSSHYRQQPLRPTGACRGPIVCSRGLGRGSTATEKPHGRVQKRGCWHEAGSCFMPSRDLGDREQPESKSLQAFWPENKTRSGFEWHIK